MNPLLVLQFAVTVAGPLQPCVDPALAWIGPRPGESVFLVEATGRTRSMPPGAQASWGSIGFEGVVTDAARDAGLAYAGPVVPGDTIWVVPWKVDGSCDRVEWSDVDWLVAGSEVVLRADRVRVHLGRRVVEVPGEYVGYPRAPSFAAQLDGTRAPDVSSWLSPRDYFRLILAAPRPASSESRSRQLERFEESYRTGARRLLRDFPGPELLERARRWAGAAR